jgi:hypothetical protein
MLGTAGGFLLCAVSRGRFGDLLLQAERRIAEHRLLEPRSERLRSPDEALAVMRSSLEGSFTIGIETIYKYRKPCEMGASG